MVAMLFFAIHCDGKPSQARDPRINRELARIMSTFTKPGVDTKTVLGLWCEAVRADIAANKLPKPTEE